MKDQEFELQSFWESTVKDTIFRFFGDDNFKFDYYSYRFTAIGDTFRIDVLVSWEKACFSVDFKESFNKVSQSPIHFVVETGKEISSRKTKRIFEALRFLQKNEKEAGHFFGVMQGFDDLSSENYYNFYQ